MFERLEGRAERAGETRASERKTGLAGELRALLPDAVKVETSDEGVLLSGLGLGRRVVLDSSLRWTIAGLLK